MTTTTILTAGQYMVPGHPFGTATGTVVALTALPSGKTKVEVNNVLLLADVLQGGIGVDFNDPATFGGIAPDNSANGGPTIIVGAYPITTQVPPQRYPILNYCVIDTASGPVLYEIDTVISDTEFIVIGSVPAPATGVLFLSGFVGGTSSVAITSAGAWLMGGEGQVMQAMPAGSLTVGYGDDQVGVFLVGSNAVSVSVTLGAMVLGGSGGGGGGGGIISINGDVTPAQVLAAGSAGTDFAIATVLGTTTFNLPVASALNTGKLSSADWTTFNSKQPGATILTTLSGLANAVGYLANDGAGNLSWSAVSGGVSSIGVLDSAAKSANGAVISGSSLVMQTADATNPGLVSTGTQTFAGSKTFSSAPTFTGFTAGSVLFAGASGLLSQDNANFFWDNTNKRFGIGTATPGSGVEVVNRPGPLGDRPEYRLTDNRVTIPNWSGVGFIPGITANTVGSLRSIDSTFGGANLTGFTSTLNTATAFAVQAYLGSTAPTGAAVALIGWKHDGSTNRTALTGSEIVLTVANGSTPIFRALANSNILINTTTDAGFRLDVNGTERVQGRLTVNQDTTVATQTVAVIQSGTTNASLVLNPNGTGALIADIPDGTAAGGNARGNYAVDLQIVRSLNTQVAANEGCVIGGGANNRAANVNGYATVGGGNTNSATGWNSTVAGGDNCTSSGSASFSVGLQNTASGNWSSVSGGQSNTASGAYSFVGGGQSNTASNAHSFANGLNQTASGQSSIALGGSAVYGSSSASSTGSVVIGGGGLTANGDGAMALQIQNISQSVYGLATGFRSISYLFGQNSRANGQFAERSDAQTSSLTFRRSITGTGISELFLDGASIRAILNITSGPTNARAWAVQVQVIAIVATQGAGTAAQNECFVGHYQCGIKRVLTTTSLIGNVTPTSELSDTNMVTSIVTIDADDTNEALRIQFTPPTTAAVDTVIRVVATAYLTEVGR